jgi:hypothetical protein
VFIPYPPAPINSLLELKRHVFDEAIFPAFVVRERGT